jgi:hypothetical protein
MSNDKIKAAARKRMAHTGESYATARAAVIMEHEAAQRRGPVADMTKLVGRLPDITKLVGEFPDMTKLVGQLPDMATIDEAILAAAAEHDSAIDEAMKAVAEHDRAMDEAILAAAAQESAIDEAMKAVAEHDMDWIASSFRDADQ